MVPTADYFALAGVTDATIEAMEAAGVDEHARWLNMSALVADLL